MIIQNKQGDNDYSTFSTTKVEAFHWKKPYPQGIRTIYQVKAAFTRK
jgi:hypothetical protein